MANPDTLSAKAKAEKYAKITAMTIVNSRVLDAGFFGPNAFFYDSAEGLLTAVILKRVIHITRDNRQQKYIAHENQ